MIITKIINLTRTSLIRPQLSYNFCNKEDILKTYLQIIPPYRIHEIIEQKQGKLNKALLSLQSRYQDDAIVPYDQSHFRVVYKEVKKRAGVIPIPILTRIMEVCCREQQGQMRDQMRKMYTKIIRVVRTKAQTLPFEDLINFIYRLAKLNKKEFQLMKQVERQILDVKIKINYPIIRKILYSFTHLNLGSSVLYNHISRTLTVGQHEFHPLELAQSAYMLSKVSENAKGGYGVYQISEKHVENMLPRMDFQELVKAASFLITQNLGSNNFQIKLQRQIYDKYPAKDRLKIKDFVMLLKATSSYYFKYKQGALLSILKTSTLRMSQFSTLEQFEQILWSWGRIGKGDQQIWSCLEKQVERHLEKLKPRQLAFFYFSLCGTSNSSETILRKIEQKFMNTQLEKIHQHYLIKFLLGMNRKRLFENQKFTKISEYIVGKLQKLKKNQLITFLKILNESDLDFEGKQKIKGVSQKLSEVGSKLISNFYLLRQTQITELLYLWVKFQINDPQLIDKCFIALDNILNIPKSVFIKAMFCFTMKQRYYKSLQFIPILEQLMKYGPIGYFFAPYQFPLLAYCIFHLQVNGQNVTISPKLLEQTKTALKQINPVILNDFVKKGYYEALKLIDKQQIND